MEIRIEITSKTCFFMTVWSFKNQFQVILVFKCPLIPKIEKINEDIAIHGDFIKDVAYTVDDLDALMEVYSILFN